MFTVLITISGYAGKGIWDFSSHHKSGKAIWQESGLASFYSPEFHGRETANGERLNMKALTAAHKTLPFNSIVRVTLLETGKSTVVRINDRGPFVKGRIIDLSGGAAKKIGLNNQGIGRVKIELLKKGNGARRSR